MGTAAASMTSVMASTSASLVGAGNDATASSAKKSRKSKGKQRAHAEVEVEEDGEQTQASKKRKRSSTKAAAAAAESASTSSDFKAVQAVMRLPLAPIFSDDVYEGVRQALESWVMRYIPSIDAVLLSVTWPPEFLEDSAPLVNSSAFGLAKVRWEGVGFRPQIGNTSTGKLSLATPSVISLLLHNLFNASISAEHIPKDRYEWDPEAKLPYSLAPKGLTRSVPQEKQPEAEAGAGAEAEAGAAGDETVAPEAAEDAQQPAGGAEDTEAVEDVDEEIAEDDYSERGCWLDKETREPLGGSNGQISFKVIGLTIANSMLSVQGSLLDDPLPAIMAASNSKVQKTSK